MSPKHLPLPFPQCHQTGVTFIPNLWLGLGLCFILVHPSFSLSSETLPGNPLSLQPGTGTALSFHMSHLQTLQLSSCSLGQHNLLCFAQNFLKMLVSSQGPHLRFGYCFFPSLLYLLGVGTGT